MPAQPSFGILGNPAVSVETPSADSAFRIAVLGDFSGRGHRQEAASPEALATRKPSKIRRENFDAVLASFKVKIVIPDLQGELFEHSIGSLDDFHPDQIHEKVDRFAFIRDEDDKATLMAALLHQPHFQEVESVWRGLDWLLRRALKGGNNVEVVLYDMTQKEFAAALNAGNDLAASVPYKMLIEQAMQGPKGEPWALWLGLYTFDLTGPDAQTLGRIAKIARHANVSFLAGAANRVLDAEFMLDGDEASVWNALRQLPEATRAGLALPRFLVRLPYGENTQSTERFPFEEFAKFDGKRGYLWGNAALACAALMTQSFLKDGWGFKPGSVIDLDAMLMHAYVEDDEEASTLAEAWLTRTMVEKFVRLGIMPIMSVKGKNAMQLSRFLSLALPPKDKPAVDLQGRWGQAGMTAGPRAAAPPGMTVSTQINPGVPPAKAAAPVAGAPAKASPPPAQEGAPSAPAESPPEEAMDPELAALMAQFDAPAAAPPPAAAAEAPPEEAMDPELAALMAQFDSPAEPAPAASEPPPEEAMDPELAALMKQMES